MKSARLLTGVAIGVMTLLPGAGALAQDGSPVAMPPMFPESCTVVAEGLNDPRYVVVAEDGTVYVTEAGNGGDELFATMPESGAGTPAASAEGEAEPPPTRGTSGQVTKVAPDGTVSVLAGGLPSYGGVGPAGIVDAAGYLWVAIGGGAAGTAFFSGAETTPAEFENSIVKIDPATGEVTLVVELGSNEVATNPDGGDVNPNLYGMTLGPDGMLYVADAGGNVIYSVNPADGSFVVAAVVPSMQELMGEEAPASIEDVRQSVPLTVTFGPDGQLHVILLSEAWEAPSILRFEDDATWTGIGTPGQFMFDIFTAADGNVYVVQGTTMFNEDGPPDPGFLATLGADGALTPVIEGLLVPFGAAMAADGSFYITINSIGDGPDPMGMLVKCTVAA